MQYWAIGVVLCIVGCFVSSTGLTLQKHSFNVGEGDKPLWQRWRWWTGFFFLVITGAFLDGVALSFTPLSIVAPLSGLTVITNSSFAYFFLGEPMSRIEMAATLVVVMGTVLTSAFGAHDSPHYDSAKLLGMFREWYMAPYYTVVAINLAASVAALLWSKCPKWLNAFAFANIAALMGGNQNLFLKCSMELARESMRDKGSNQWDGPTPYIFVIFTIVTATSQLVMLNVGLSKHNNVTFLPAYQSGLTVYGCIAGGIYFRDFWGFSVLAWLFFPTGIAIIIAGLAMIAVKAYSAPSQVQPVEDGLPPEEEGLLDGAEDGHCDIATDSIEVAPVPASTPPRTSVDSSRGNYSIEDLPGSEDDDDYTSL